MADFTADFEAGVDGATITTGAGEASATAWGTIEGTPPATYDDTHVAHGSLAAKIVGDDEALGWNITSTDHYGRMYVYATANPSVVSNLVKVWNGGTTVAYIYVNSSGQIAVQDTAGAHSQAGSVSIALNQWVRVEWRVIHSATVGQIEAKLFNSPDSTTATETVTSPATWNTAAAPTFIGFTDFDFAWGTDVWVDDIVANATVYPGPAAADPYRDEVLADNPWLYWRLNDVSGTTAVDSSGNGRTGTYSGSPTLAQTPVITAGSSVLFDATNDYALSTSAIFNSSQATVEVWFDYDGTPPSSGTAFFVAGCVEGDGGATTDKAISIDVNGCACFYTYDGGVKAAVGATSLSTGVHHLVGTVTGTHCRIYVDGVEDGIAVSSGSYAGYANPNVLVGGRSSSGAAGDIRKAGRRDEAAWYTTALSAARVLAHYAAGAAAESAPQSVRVIQANRQGW